MANPDFIYRHKKQNMAHSKHRSKRKKFVPLIHQKKSRKITISRTAKYETIENHFRLSVTGCELATIRHELDKTFGPQAMTERNEKPSPIMPTELAALLAIFD